MNLDAKSVFRLYSMSWCIEVVHKEMNQLLRLGKCPSLNFAAQFASILVTAIQYNIQGYVKCKESYQTIGGLFASISSLTVELTVAQKIWNMIWEVVSAIVKLITCETFDLIDSIIKDNEKI